MSPMPIVCDFAGVGNFKLGPGVARFKASGGPPGLTSQGQCRPKLSNNTKRSTGESLRAVTACLPAWDCSTIWPRTEKSTHLGSGDVAILF